MNSLDKKIVKILKTDICDAIFPPIRFQTTSDQNTAAFYLPLFFSIKLTRYEYELAP